MLWVALFTFPLMAAVQEICDRTALASGKGLGELIVVRFGRVSRVLITFLLGLLIIANALNIAADLVAIGAGMRLLHAGTESLWALIAGALLITLVFTGSFDFTARVLKVFCVALLAYIVVLFFISVPWGTVVMHTLTPHVTFSKGYLALLIAVLGTTISPYLFFWQSLHRIEEMREEKAGGEKPLALTRRSRMAAAKKQSTSRFDVFSGMAISNAIMFAIIVATAVTLGSHGHHVAINSPAQAASALKPVAGRMASFIFAFGFIGSGMLGIPVLAGSGAAGLSGMLGRPTGYSKSPHSAPLFYALCVIGIGGGMTFSLLSVNPITLLVFVAVINGVAAAPFLAVTMLVSSDRQIMGTYVNGRLALVLGWATVALMTIAALLLVVI
jgi:Mn2+/Fe2+ NRAMP family transporter